MVCGGVGGLNHSVLSEVGVWNTRGGGGGGE
jgi:hypothetical protein